MLEAAKDQSEAKLMELFKLLNQGMPQRANNLKDAQFDSEQIWPKLEKYSLLRTDIEASSEIQFFYLVWLALKNVLSELIKNKNERSKGIRE